MHGPVGIREFPYWQLKGDFLKQKIAILSPNKIFGKKPLKPFFRGPFPPHLHKKLEKSNEAILHKVHKTLFLGSFLPKFTQKKFLSKIGLRHFLGIIILYHCAKNQKILMSQSREKLVTDEQTNERTDERTTVNLKDLQGRSKKKSADLSQIGMVGGSI